MYTSVKNISSKKRFALFYSLLLWSGSLCAQDLPQVEIAILGTFHFNQFHKQEIPKQNFFGPKRQEEITNVVSALKTWKPDQIYIEREPSSQLKIDSLYHRYLKGSLVLETLGNGASEVYQVGFRLSKQLHLKAPTCVDHYQGTSQSLLTSGKNIDRYLKALKDFQNLGRSVVSTFLNETASLSETLTLMNKAENVQRSHQLLFNIPAYVQDGEFTSYQNLDKGAIDEQYIGAEFISLFYERNLKIYSNILNAQLKDQSKRILVIIGQVHVGVLQDLLENNGNFKVLPSTQLLNPKE